MRDFRELKVWQKAHGLTLTVYKVTAGFPKAELYGLTAQLRRATVSISANISEGAGKNSRPEFARFLQISLGSASEVEYELLLARDLGYLDRVGHNHLTQQTVEVKRMLTRFIQYLNNSQTGDRGSKGFLRADG